MKPVRPWRDQARPFRMTWVDEARNVASILGQSLVLLAIFAAIIYCIPVIAEGLRWLR